MENFLDVSHFVAITINLLLICWNSNNTRHSYHDASPLNGLGVARSRSSLQNTMGNGLGNWSRFQRTHFFNMKKDVVARNADVASANPFKLIAGTCATTNFNSMLPLQPYYKVGFDGSFLKECLVSYYWPRRSARADGHYTTKLRASTLKYKRPIQIAWPKT